MTKTKKIIYWISTLWLASGMLSSGILQLTKAPVEGAVSPPGAEGIARLGYPLYFLTIIGIWKILGVIALLVPKFPVVKEWAYAGFFFLTTGALFSHIASGHSIGEFFPSVILLVMTVVSWFLRPSNRRIASAL